MLPIWCDAPVKAFFPLLSFWTRQFWCLLVLLQLCFTSSTSAKCFPLRTIFMQGNKKKVTQGEIGWIGRMEYRGHAVFGQKLLNTQHSVGRCAWNQPWWMGKCIERVFRKNSLTPSAASHNKASWCTDTGGFLKLPPRGEVCATRGPSSRR